MTKTQQQRWQQWQQWIAEYRASEQPKWTAQWRKMATDLLQGIHLAQPRVEWFVSNDDCQRELLHDVACAIPRLCPGIAVAKVVDPQELTNLGS